MNKEKGIESKEVEGETILFNKKNEFFVLNKTGTFIWKKINGKNSENQIASELTKKYGIKKEKALKDTKELIKKLSSLKLIKK